MRASQLEDLAPSMVGTQRCRVPSLLFWERLRVLRIISNIPPAVVPAPTNAHRSHIHLGQCNTMQTDSVQYRSCRVSFFMQEYRPKLGAVSDQPKYCQSFRQHINQPCTHCSLLFRPPHRTTRDPSIAYGTRNFRHRLSMFKLFVGKFLPPHERPSIWMSLQSFIIRCTARARGRIVHQVV
jgi:hypothetical protein